MILLSAHISKITTMADGSWRLVADLGELRPDKVGELSKTANKVVLLALTLEEGFSEEEEQVLNDINHKNEHGKEWYE